MGLGVSRRLVRELALELEDLVLAVLDSEAEVGELHCFGWRHLVV